MVRLMKVMIIQRERSIDDRFDHGEVQSIDYQVDFVKEVEQPSGQSCVDEDLQELLGGDDEDDDEDDDGLDDDDLDADDLDF